MEPMLTSENWRLICEQLIQLSDDSLSTQLSGSIRRFLQERPQATFEEADQFLHEVRDWAVYTGGGSSFVMTYFNILLGDARRYPPPDETGDWMMKWISKDS